MNLYVNKQQMQAVLKTTFLHQKLQRVGYRRLVIFELIS